MKLIAIFIAGLFASASGAATPVDLKFKISGPDGPLANFYLRAMYRTSDKAPAPAYAKTDQAGEVTFHCDRDTDTDVEIVVGDPNYGVTQLEQIDDAAENAFRETVKHLGLPPRWLVRIPEGVATVQKSVHVSAARSVHVIVPEALTNPKRWASLGISGYQYGICTIDRATRVLTRTGVPINQAFTGYFTFDESDIHGRSIAISIPAAPGDVNLPDIVIPLVTYNATVLVEEVPDNRVIPVEALQGRRSPGVTLISADGQIILSAITTTQAASKVPVPAGTYYYVPGDIGPEDFQVKLIQKLAAGVDVSASIPHVTVSAGEIKTLQVNAIDTFNAISALP